MGQFSMEVSFSWIHIFIAHNHSHTGHMSICNQQCQVDIYRVSVLENECVFITTALHPQDCIGLAKAVFFAVSVVSCDVTNVRPRWKKIQHIPFIPIPTLMHRICTKEWVVLGLGILCIHRV